jgi:bacterioferritin-associated ferredoxin
MYVCSCRGVTDRTVCAAIAAGARTIEDLSDRCSAGERCGGCWPELERLLAEQQGRDAQRDTRLAV